MGAAGLANGCGQVVDEDVATAAHLRSDRLGRSCVHAGHDDLVDAVGVPPRSGEGSAVRVSSERAVALLTELLFPLLGPCGAGHAPAVDELIGCRRATTLHADGRTVVGALPDEDGRRTVTATDFVGTGGEAVAAICGDEKGRRHAGQGEAEGANG